MNFSKNINISFHTVDFCVSKDPRQATCMHHTPKEGDRQGGISRFS